MATMWEKFALKKEAARALVGKVEEDASESVSKVWEKFAIKKEVAKAIWEKVDEDRKEGKDG